MATSSGSTASGLMVTSRNCIEPVTVISTAPPPERPVTSASAAWAWASMSWLCISMAWFSRALMSNWSDTEVS